MFNLWDSTFIKDWQQALEKYSSVIEGQDVAKLPDHDCWYHEELPGLLAKRQPVHITHAELVRVTEWKMARGVWRARNLMLVRGNEEALVVETSTAAYEAMPHPSKPIAILSKLAGVGPATASAVLAAKAPEIYPFFDEVVAGQIRGLGKVAFTPGYYNRYAEALRERAGELGDGWTPGEVERALWANAGGKAGLA